MAARILHWKTSLQVWIVTLQFSFKFGGLNKGRGSTTMQIIVLASQLVQTNWLLNHLEQQRIETLGRAPFCVHCTSHAGSLLGDRLGELCHPQTPCNSQELLPFHGLQEQSFPDDRYSAKVDQDL